MLTTKDNFDTGTNDSGKIILDTIHTTVPHLSENDKMTALITFCMNAVSLLAPGCTECTDVSKNAVQ
jgi:hypothetical protein